MPLSCLPPLPSFLFAAWTVSGVTSKALHIALHIRSLPFLYFVLYSPTLILPDLLLIILARILLQYPAPESRLQWLVTCLGGLSSLITWAASAIQVGFFMQTGAEVAWSASNSFLSDPAAMKILLSGISTVSAAWTVLGLVAWLTHAKLYQWSGAGLQAIRQMLVGGYKARYSLLPTSRPSKNCLASVDLRTVRRVSLLVAAGLSLLFLELTRPPIPYDHLSGALPLTLLEAFNPHKSAMHGYCGDSSMFFGDGGIPGPAGWSRPTWLPKNPPPGFARWDISPEERIGKKNVTWDACGNDFGGSYNPRRDPLKISNLDEDVYAPLKKAFKDHSVAIDHVVLLTLESGRKDLFPAQQGTPMFDGLLASHPEKDRKAAIDRLVGLTPIAQMLTGEYALDSEGKKVDLNKATWKDPAEDGMGGLNVRGALTGSSLTLKSMLSSHCGVQPLPVDLLEESALEVYQPCLPQLFELFNQAKSSEKRAHWSDGSVLQNRWKSVYMQPGTDTYDRQDIMNDRMGFNEKVIKDDMEGPDSKHPAKGKEVNYFGYAENELRPFMQDLFAEAAKNNTRIFLSHLTSTTHHPWGIPSDFEKVQYMGSHGTLDHDPMNSYLNTIRFVDTWVGEMMGLLEEAGIANSTLVVIVGDHGQAFVEDNKDMTGTYENSHISNFRVPLVFRHPHMPRIDINTNATSLSIIPTILDLLVQSGSLDAQDTEIASALLPEYQGQSLIRPYIPSVKEDHPGPPPPPFGHDHPPPPPPGPPPPGHPPHEHHGPRVRSAWNFGLINAGGSIISVTAADSPYRLILPIKDTFEYGFSDLRKDPGELHPMKAWSLSSLEASVRSKHGEEAAHWVHEADKVGRWWVNEQIRIWGYKED
ncbi:Alkaline phosphatase-like alpha/beta/alpha [Penicillium capsulatum]|uniref:Alkaline phosphatase-like alpha/beta/alpha n=1 Tax=Penicillium capsulatum TaxID=69766 RepID=A0A9W9IC79_9EURO|nr:Alkaline phosphatase-like alpha/beta/alpha [Penicillium capsulatum]KAJ6135286.1 Alkaline phosphatase-like alpha/beta/alpha [Penicillium capsulatum]